MSITKSAAVGSDASARDAAKSQAPRNTAGSWTKGGKSSTDDWTNSAATPQGGGKTAHDDWQATGVKSSASGNASSSAADLNQDGKSDRRATPASSNGQPRVATGDVNGDGRADVAVSNTSHSNTKNSQDVASGHPSGKRQHEPVTVHKETDAASPK